MAAIDLSDVPEDSVPDVAQSNGAMAVGQGNLRQRNIYSQHNVYTASAFQHLSRAAQHDQQTRRMLEFDLRNETTKNKALNSNVELLKYKKECAFVELLQLNDQIVVEREEYRSHVTELQNTIAAKEVEVSNLRKKCEDCEKLIKSQSEQIASLKAIFRTNSVEEQLVKQEQDILKLEDCKAEAENNLQATNLELEELTDERNKWIKSYHESINVSNQKIAECEKKIELLIGQLLKKEKKCSKLKHKVKRLQITQTLMEQIYNIDHKSYKTFFVFSVLTLAVVSCFLIFLVSM